MVKGNNGKFIVVNRYRAQTVIDKRQKQAQYDFTMTYLKKAVKYFNQQLLF